MSNHHHQSKATQIYNKARGVEPFHFEKNPYPPSESMKPEDIQTKAAVDEGSIQLLAYRIYRERGGSALDNWLEAERILRNNDQTALSLIGE